MKRISLPDGLQLRGAVRDRLGHAAAACAVALATSLAAGSTAAQDITAAERLLFQTSHLRNVAAPGVLRYDYVRQERDGPGFRDEVRIAVNARNADGSTGVASEFLHGDRQLPIPTVQEAEGNPALLGFLERDINEMKRLTGGATGYFRKRIRLALAESARVEEVMVDHGGRKVRAQRIAIQPYLDDPMRDKMPKYAAKQYEFILSDAIPGALYRLSATVPAQAAGGGAPAIQETMTFRGAER